jgi:hypothetical protein
MTTITYNDYPELFLGEGNDQNMYLCMLEQDSPEFIYLICRITIDTLKKLLSNQIDLFDVYKKPPENTLYLSSSVDLSSFSILRKKNVDDVSEDYFPERGIVFENSDYERIIYSVEDVKNVAKTPKELMIRGRFVSADLTKSIWTIKDEKEKTISGVGNVSLLGIVLGSLYEIRIQQNTATNPSKGKKKTGCTLLEYKKA